MRYVGRAYVGLGSECVARPSWDRHPKTFTTPAVARASASSQLHLSERTSVVAAGKSLTCTKAQVGQSHSINSSARPDNGSGTVSPSALAVLRLMISVYLS